jgi:tRNA U34 2-thiouridine synthase MnmA/TrmU
MMPNSDFLEGYKDKLTEKVIDRFKNGSFTELKDVYPYGSLTSETIKCECFVTEENFKEEIRKLKMQIAIMGKMIQKLSCIVEEQIENPMYVVKFDKDQNIFYCCKTLRKEKE